MSSPRARFPKLEQDFAELRSITAALRASGVDDYLRRTSRITARLPDDREAEQLRQAINRPVLVVEAVNVDATERPIQFARTRFASDRVQLVVET